MEKKEKFIKRKVRVSLLEFGADRRFRTVAKAGAEECCWDSLGISCLVSGRVIVFAVACVILIIKFTWSKEVKFNKNLLYRSSSSPNHRFVLSWQIKQTCSVVTLKTFSLTRLSRCTAKHVIVTRSNEATTRK